MRQVAAQAEAIRESLTAAKNVRDLVAAQKSDEAAKLEARITELMLEEKQIRTQIDHEVRRARAAGAKTEGLAAEKEQIERALREKAEENTHIEESVQQARSQLSRIQAEKS